MENEDEIVTEGSKHYLVGEQAKNPVMGNKVCCRNARKIIHGGYHCVCLYRSHCPDHGVRCVGTHD